MNLTLQKLDILGVHVGGLHNGLFVLQRGDRAFDVANVIDDGPQCLSISQKSTTEPCSD